VLAKALARNPEDRYQTTLEFAAAFAEAAGAKPSGPSTTDSGLLGRVFGR
jgi:hypothetical protein